MILKILLPVTLVITLLVIAQIVNWSIIQPVSNNITSTTPQNPQRSSSLETETQDSNTSDSSSNIQIRADGEEVRFFGRVVSDIQDEDISIEGDRYLVEVLTHEYIENSSGLPSYLVVNYIQPNSKLNTPPGTFYTEFDVENNWYVIKKIGPVIYD